MADAEQRLQIYSDTVPPQLMHETQLAMRQSGYSRTDVSAALKQLDERFARLADAAQSAPQLVQGAIADVRQSLREVVDRLDASSRETTAALNAERAALFSNIQSEREAMVTAVDTQRKAFAADASRVADGAMQSAGEQLRLVVAGRWMWPRNPLTGQFPSAYEPGPRCKCTLHWGPDHAARLLVPVIG